MKIYSMTATFGKLEHKTLTLEPGLNIIEAPNEWGKSTWCAFLVTMLYGLDTRAKTTKAALADKERFAPWSGAPMSGRIDLNWGGRDITIERASRGRTPMGVFRAYETATGIEIPELTATNCGQMLLGVERSVFTRSAFLRFSDLPVTQDDALRHRLNALVTTGDESGAAEALGQKLRDLKNRCRYNRSGLLPQAEAQRDTLEGKLNELKQLTEQSRQLKNRQQELAERVAQLENHKAALAYAAAQEDIRRVKDAAATHAAAKAQFQQLQSACAQLPSQKEAQQAITQLDELRRNMDALQMEEQQIPPIPQVPQTPPSFAGIRPEDTVSQAENDRAVMTALIEPKKPPTLLLTVLAIAVVIAAIAVAILSNPIYGIILLLGGVGLMAASIAQTRKYQKQLTEVQEKRNALCARYGTDDVRDWVTEAHIYAAAWSAYQQSIVQIRSQQVVMENRREILRQQSAALSGWSRDQWQEVLISWDSLERAQRSMEQTQHHFETLQAMVKDAPVPVMPDALTYSEPETLDLLSDAAYEQQSLQHRLGQCLGQMDGLGSAEALNRELDAVQRRIYALEQTYGALEQALNALSTARQELQRRFAPRITKRSQELFAQLTGNRYNRLTLGEDLSMQAGAQDEDVLRSQQWRSDGTIDQLYLALRLAVAQELIPHAPLILDDALVRFDEIRLTEAMKILRQEAQTKQVILFTCQGRENAALKE